MQLMRHAPHAMLFILCNRLDRQMYYGMLFGSHESHGGNNNRVCVDTERDGDWNDSGNWAGYIYPTIERGNIQSRTGQKVVRCMWCCKA